ncbi:MAG: SGNH/GDSL hydrolase family protein [Microbacteriaceae bacterium]
MSAVHRLSRLAVVPVAPVIYAQGKKLRRDTPRLPDAALPWTGYVATRSGIAGFSPGNSAPLRLLVLGDSTAAGVGADTQDSALPGNLARELSARWDRDISWRAIGENGATARDLLERFLEAATAEPFDFIFLTVGANDALGLRSRSAFGADIRQILARLRRVNPTSTIMMSSLPAFFRFELLPQPLKWNLYLHSTNLEGEARRIIAEDSAAIMSPPPPPYTDGFFASDLFHPSAQGYEDWARFAIDDAFTTGQLA